MLDEPVNQTIDTIVRLMQKADSLLFITGAGISAESGIPTYRGVGGLYEVDTTEDGVCIEDALSSLMLAENPALTWKYLAQIGVAVQGKKHNRAHEVIAEMERHFPRVWTLTQNVDGFHRDAGSVNLVEAHGNMHSLSCVRCDFKSALEDMADLEKVTLEDLPPKCPRCQNLVRPDVVLFGELLPEDGLATIYQELGKGFDMVFSVGTSSGFPYIQEPIRMAKAVGKPTIEINPGETSASHLVDYHLPMKAGVALDEIWRRYRHLTSN